VIIHLELSSLQVVLVLNVVFRQQINIQEGISCAGGLALGQNAMIAGNVTII
jgi:hypothetical protein